MTVAELSRLLYDLKVPPHMYRLDGRGGQSDRIDFDDEELACEHLFGRVGVELVQRGQLVVLD
jgi:hypothetical protein